MATIVERVGVSVRPAAVRVERRAALGATSPCPPNFTYRRTKDRCFCDPVLQGLHGRGLGEEIPCPEMAPPMVATSPLTPVAPKTTLFRTSPATTLPPISAETYQQPPPSTLPKAPPEYALPQLAPAPGTTVEQPSPDPRDMVFPTPGDGDFEEEAQKADGGMSPWLIGGAIAGAGFLFLLFSSRDDEE